MRHGSLFSGYGGLDLAIADVFGAETAWVSDVDPGPNVILAKRYPHAPNLGDITRIDWATVEPVDIISGGSPCQDLSHAGRRAGMTPGTRSNLWESMREAIAVLKPTYVVWENVRGAMSAKAASGLEHCPGCMGDPGDGKRHLRALGRVLGDLADLGYDAQWHGLRAADVGACHGRWRVFVLAYTNEQRHERQRGARDGWARPANGSGEAIALLPTPRATDGTKGGPQDPAKRRAGGHSVSIEDAVHRLTLLPTPTTEPMTGNGHARNLGKEVQLLPTPRTENNENRQSEDRYGPNLGMALGTTPGYEHRLLPTPSVADTQGGRKSRSGERNGELLLNGIAHADHWGKYAEAIARHEHAFGQPAPAPTEAKPAPRPTLNRHGNQRSDQTGQRLSAAFVEWMMMLPAGWVTDCGITRNQALKALGNGVVPPQAAAALRLMLDRMTLT